MSRIPTPQDSTDEGKIVLRIKYEDSKGFCFVRNPVENQSDVSHLSQRSLLRSHQFSPNSDSSKDDSDFSCKQGLGFQKNLQESIFYAEKESDKIDLDRNVEHSASRYVDKEAENLTQSAIELDDDLEPAVKLNHSIGAESLSLKERNDFSRGFTNSHTVRNTDTICPDLTSRDVSWETAVSCGLDDILPITHSTDGLPATFQIGDFSGTASVAKHLPHHKSKVVLKHCEGQPFASTKLCPKKEESSSKKRLKTVLFDTKKGKFFSVLTISDSEKTACSKKEVIKNTTNSPLHSFNRKKQYVCVVSEMPHLQEPCQNFKGMDQSHALIKSHVREKSSVDKKDSALHSCSSFKEVIKPQHPRINSSLKSYESASSQTSYRIVDCPVQKKIFGKRKKKRGYDFSRLERNQNSKNHSQETVRQKKVLQHPSEKGKWTQVKTSKSEILCKCGPAITQDDTSRKFCTNCNKRRFKFQSATQQRLAKQTTESLSKTVSMQVKDHTYCLPFQGIRESCYNQLHNLEVKEELQTLCVDVLKENGKTPLVFHPPYESHSVCWTSNNSCVESSLHNKQLENFSSTIEVCERKDVDGVSKEISPNDDEMKKLQIYSVLQFVKLPYPIQFRLAETSPVFPLKPCYVVIDRLLVTDSGDLKLSTSCSRYCREECLEFLCAFGTLRQCSKCVSSHNHEDSEEEEEEAWFPLKQNHSLVKKHNSLEGGEENGQKDLPEISEKQFSDSQSDNLKDCCPDSQCGERNTEINNDNNSTESKMKICHSNFESSNDIFYDTEASESELKEMKVASHEISNDMPSKKEKVGPEGITKHPVCQTPFTQDFVRKELPSHCNISQRSDLKEAVIKKTLGNMFRISKFNIKYYVFETVGRAFFVPLMRGRAKSKLDEEDLAYVKRTIVQMLNDKRTCARHLPYPECLKHREAAEFDLSSEKLEKGNNSPDFSRSLSSLDEGTLETLINNGQLSKLIPRTSGQNLVEYLEQIGQCLNACLMENGETATDWIKAMAKDIAAKQKRDKRQSAKRLKPSKDVAIEIDIAHDGGDIDVGEENIWINDPHQGEFVVGVPEDCENGTALPVLSNIQDRFECAQFMQPESSGQSLCERSGSFVCEEAYVQERKPLLGELISASMFSDGYPAGQQTDNALLSCEGSQDAASELLQDPVMAMPLSREMFCESGITLDTSGSTVYVDCNRMLIKSEISIESGEGHERCGAPVSEHVNSEFSPSASVPVSLHNYSGYQIGGLSGEQLKLDQQTILESEKSPNPTLTYALIKQEPLDECFPLAWPISPQEGFQRQGIHIPGTSEAALPCISSVTFGAAALEMTNNAECDRGSVNDLSSKAYLDDEVSLCDRELNKPEHLIDVGFPSHYSQLSSKQDQCVIRTNSSCLTQEEVYVEAMNLTEQHLMSQGYPKVCHAAVPLTILDERIELVGEQTDDLTSNMPRDERSCNITVGNEGNHVLPTAVVKREQISFPANYTDIQGIHFYGHTSAFSCPQEEGGYVQITPFPSEHSSPVENLVAFNDTYKSGVEMVHTAAFDARWNDGSCPEDLENIDEGSVGSSPWDENSFHHDSCDDFVQDDSDDELRGAIQAAVSSALCEEAQPVTRENAIGNAEREMMAHQGWPTSWSASADQYVKHGSSGNSSCVTGLADGVIEIGSLITGADHTTIKPFAMCQKELTPRVKRGSKRKARGGSTIRSKGRGRKATPPSSEMIPLSSCTKSSPGGLCVASEVATSPELSPGLVPSFLGISNSHLKRLTQRVRSPASDGTKRSQAKGNVEPLPTVTSEIRRERCVGKRVTCPGRQRKCRSSGRQRRSQRNEVCSDLTDIPDIEIDKAVEENFEGSLLTEVNDGRYTEAGLTVCNQAEVSPKSRPKSRPTAPKQRKGVKRKFSEVKKASATNSVFSLESPRAQVSTTVVKGFSSRSDLDLFSKMAQAATCLEEPSKTDVGGASERSGVGDSLNPTSELASGASSPSGNVAAKKPVRDRERSFFDCLPESFLDAWKA